MLVNGLFKILYIKILGNYMPIGCLEDNSFQESSQELDTTTRDNPNGWETSIPTKQSYSIDFNGFIEIDGDGSKVSFRDLQDIKRNRTLIEWKVENSKGDDVDYGSGHILSLSDSSSIDSFISFTGNIKGYGQPLIEDASIVYEFDVFDDVYE